MSCDKIIYDTPPNRHHMDSKRSSSDSKPGTWSDYLIIAEDNVENIYTNDDIPTEPIDLEKQEF